MGVSDDRSEGDMGDILDAIIAEGSSKVCKTPWAFVVKIEGDRLVKIESGASWAWRKADRDSLVRSVSPTPRQLKFR